MSTIKQAIDFASDLGVTVGVDVQNYKGCVETVKSFSVYKGSKLIRIEQLQKGSRKWMHSGSTYYNRAAAIISAVTMITGTQWTA
ncbi:hypothetical protein HCH73_21785 [Citrobacter koseri]|uniref:hypothetical protein n=1 Tax=Citrobacter koseri TaxID=545 RepID=UPI0018E18E6B|nr:hypothetical protein [Citrobacter koseri]MBI0679648.1 hypothetical protein [Citrobacter koseri]